MKIDPESHLDHGLTQAHIDHMMERFADKTTFFIETFEMPAELPDLMNGLYGPRVGDPPVTEDQVHYKVRGDRKGESRMIAKPPRPTRMMTVIAGPADDVEGIVLYTAYGGVSAERAPFDAPEDEKEKSARFWSEHALASEGQ